MSDKRRICTKCGESKHYAAYSYGQGTCRSCSGVNRAAPATLKVCATCSKHRRVEAFHGGEVCMYCKVAAQPRKTNLGGNWSLPSHGLLYRCCRQMPSGYLGRTAECAALVFADALDAHARDHGCSVDECWFGLAGMDGPWPGLS